MLFVAFLALVEFHVRPFRAFAPHFDAEERLQRLNTHTCICNGCSKNISFGVEFDCKVVCIYLIQLLFMSR